VATEFPLACDKANTGRVLVAPDQSIYVCGWLDDCCGFVEHFDASPSLDKNFGDKGWTGMGGTNATDLASAYDCALHGDAIALAAYLGLFEIDTKGKAIFSTSDPESATDTFTTVAVAEDGTIYAAATADSGTTSTLRAFHADGSVDGAFGTSGDLDVKAPLTAVLVRHDGLVTVDVHKIVRMGFDGSGQAVVGDAGGGSATQDSCGRIVTGSSTVVLRYWP